MSGGYEQRAALYYPYIHIRSENWLKSTILAFQSVKRIVPNRYELADSERIQAYATLTDRNGTPLLDNARIYGERVKQAQTDLFETLKKHQTKLVSRYSETKTPEQFRWGPDVFQVNRYKLLDPVFSDWLIKKGLAWNIRGFQRHDSFEWLAMHPQMGAAIMSVLALAVAKQDALNVVTPSTEVHNTLLANTHEQVLNRLLGLRISPDDEVAEKVSVQALCQIVLTAGFDLTRLTPDDIRDMVVEGRHELRTFYGRMSTFVGNIPGDVDKGGRQHLLRLKAEEVLEDWRQCVAKLPQLREAVREAATEKGLEMTIDAVSVSFGGQLSWWARSHRDRSRRKSRIKDASCQRITVSLPESSEKGRRQEHRLPLRPTVACVVQLRMLTFSYSSCTGDYPKPNRTHIGSNSPSGTLPHYPCVTAKYRSTHGE
ncbi:MAG TPA: hypothetical protein VLI55_13335 [Bryobacteraceae bacterium]|nr:hypothetical protein [Bryobacteraceae bacterium]